MTWRMRWCNRSLIIVYTPLELLDIYIYIYIYEEEEYLEVTESDCIDGLLSKWTDPTWADQKSTWNLVHYVGPKEF